MGMIVVTGGWPERYTKIFFVRLPATHRRPKHNHYVNSDAHDDNAQDGKDADDDVVPVLVGAQFFDQGFRITITVD